MTDSSQHCIPCEGNIKPMTLEEVTLAVKKLNNWQFDEKKQRIIKRYSFKNFLRTMSFMNAVAWIANQENHHPDCTLGFNYCEVAFQTHAIDGVSQNDIICAQKVDLLYVH